MDKNQLTQNIAYLVGRYGITTAEAYDVLITAKYDVGMAQLLCNLAKDTGQTPAQFLTVLE